MQINTDLSPVVSPKSNISSSFTSPKDSLLPALNFNQIRPQNSGNLPFNSSQPFPKYDKSPTGSFIPVINNQNNTTTTNESFSIEKNTYLEENSNRDSEESSNSEILILQGNSIEAENLNDEEEMAKTPSHPIHILEFEEFVLNENIDKSPLVKENFIEKSPNNQRPKFQKKITFPQNILPATEPSEEPVKAEDVPKESKPSPRDQVENEKKSNGADFEFKSGTDERGTSSLRSNNEEKPKVSENKPKGFGNKRNLKPLDVTEDAEEGPKESKPSPKEKTSNEVTDLEFKSGNEEVKFKLNNKAFENKPKGFGNKRNLKPLDVTEETEEVPKESQPSPKAQIENEVTHAEFKSGNEEVEFKLNNKAFENKSKGFGNKRNLKPLDVTEEPEDDTKAADFKQENSILKNEVQELNKRIQELLKENAQIKQERSERPNTGRDSERMQREREEIKNKFLLDENRALRDNQNKYQAIINEKDEQIHQLRLENEEISKNSKNELYIPLVDKVRLLKEKVTQSSKQIEEQVEVIESKNIAIENLLFKMEKLTDSLAQKTNQVTDLQEEIEKLKANTKESSMDYKSQQQQPKNVGSLYAKIRDKEKYWFSPEKRPETSDAHYRKSYSPTNSQGSERKVSRPNSSTAKTKDSTQKAVIKLATINQDNKSIDDQYSKSNHWSTMKWNMLNQREKLEKESAEKNQNLYKKMKNRSIDHYTSLKNESKNESKSSSKNESRVVENKKNTQNIEDLQKRLAYLKYKRQEFEKKKHEETTSKDDVKTASDILATTTSFAESSKYPVTKQLDSLISPSRNIVLGRYRESSMTKEDENRKNESQGTSQIYTHKAAQKAVPVYKSIELNPEVDMSYAMKNLKTSFTSKHGIHAKIDNYTSSTPSQGHYHQQQQQAEEDFKNAGRYHSYSNVSKFFNKISENQKSYKRSYDLSSHSKIPELRSVTEASTKNKGDFFK